MPWGAAAQQFLSPGRGSESDKTPQHTRSMLYYKLPGRRVEVEVASHENHDAGTTKMMSVLVVVILQLLVIWVPLNEAPKDRNTYVILAANDEACEKKLCI
jgi:hypothetical protein